MQLGMNYLMLGRTDEAEPLLLECHDRCLKTFDPNHSNIVYTSIALGRFYIAKQEWEMAEPLLLNALETCRRVYSPRALPAGDVMEHLATLYMRTQRWDKAELLLIDMAKSIADDLGDLEPNSLEPIVPLLQFYLRTDRYAEAESLVREMLGSITPYSPLYMHITSMVAALGMPVKHPAYYTIVQTLGNDTFGGKSTGQTFTPMDGIIPNPGAVKALNLIQITLYHGNTTDQAPSPTTFLNIYDGDPHAGGSLVGSSSNRIDTTEGFRFHSPMIWKFDGITLDPSREYWAIMESSGNGGLLDVAVSLETSDRTMGDLYPSGSGLIVNQRKERRSVDARFEILLADTQGSN